MQAMGKFLRKVWTPPLRFPPSLVMNVILECCQVSFLLVCWEGMCSADRPTRFLVQRFGHRFVGPDTFVFETERYLHTACQLGKGAEGAVHLGFHLDTGRAVAIKTIRLALVEQPGFEEKLTRGMEFMMSANHGSIVKLFHVAKTGSCWYQYLEYIDGGDLQMYMRQHGALPEAKAKVRRLRVEAPLLRLLMHTRRSCFASCCNRSRSCAARTSGTAT